MKKEILKIPIKYRYLSDWIELLDILPKSGKYIINKKRTGCGGTTLFLESNFPCIIVSPRSNMLYSKKAQYPNTYLFRTHADRSTSVVTLKSRLKDYIGNLNINTPFGTKHIIPKILVTIDSYPYVAEELSYLGLLSEYTVLVDEFQCLLSDSKFKGKTELEFLHNLKGPKSICLLSATPIEENYLDNIPDLSDIGCYYTIEWDKSVLEHPNLEMRPYKSKQSSKSICKEIVENYKKNGYFAQKYIDGKIVESKEVVIFLNDVRTIIQIIKENKLNPDEVNVLCSSSNKRISELKHLGVHLGELCTDKEHPKNRTYQFVTRCCFEGTDMYSLSAFTYIFCDGVLDWNKNDLIIDVPQIIGRQRLRANPWWKDAVLYYRPSSKADTEKMETRIQAKYDRTEQWIEKYNASDDETKMMLVDGIRKRSDKTRYSDDYVEVVDDLSGGFVVRANNLVLNTEIRDLELSSYVYNNPLSIISTVEDGTDCKVSHGSAYITKDDEPDLKEFKQQFSGTTSFSEQLRIYADFRDNHPEYERELYDYNQIKILYHQLYNTLGSKRLKSLRYREKDVTEAYQTQLGQKDITCECKKMFKPGHSYLLSEVKVMLQKIYDELGIKKKAKACDIEKYIKVEKKQITNKDNKKREIYYQIKKQ